MATSVGEIFVFTASSLVGRLLIITNDDDTDKIFNRTVYSNNEGHLFGQMPPHTMRKI